MRKLFTERVRLVVYVEASDLTRLTERAREEGKTLVEWARETLLGELEDNSDVPRAKPVRRPNQVRSASMEPRRAGAAGSAGDWR